MPPEEWQVLHMPLLVLRSEMVAFSPSIRGRGECQLDRIDAGNLSAWNRPVPIDGSGLGGRRERIAEGPLA